jgi:hypothetical protein
MTSAEWQYRQKDETSHINSYRLGARTTLTADLAGPLCGMERQRESLS